MRFGLVNPGWRFDGSIYFGCREAHLPLEFGYSKQLLEATGHSCVVIDGQMDELSPDAIGERVRAFSPDSTVLTTAPSYLFWRCAPPELRIPMETADRLRGAGRLVVVGPHASTTPRATLRKMRADAAVIGECEEILPLLAERDWSAIPSLAYRDGDGVRINGGPHASDMTRLPALHWPAGTIARHRHHHHRFDRSPDGPGAEMEVSRGCPYHCTFCAKENFRNQYRRRPLGTILEELDGLISQGATYVYFIDEIFLPWAELLQAVAARQIEFGMQTRIDLWNERMIDLLGEARCVSIEAGVESISEEGRAHLDKKCRMSTDELAERLIYAKQRVAFVQANLIEMRQDDPAEVDAFRRQLLDAGVWANEPVPLFPYPGSPDYTRLWGQPDDRAWERAHDYYLGRYTDFSDIQEDHPEPLVQLEATPAR
jgi:B12-binding domain/radical SAM domain protein of rhizo-twelve system